MQFSPIVRRVALAAAAGVGTAGVMAGVLLLSPLAASVLLSVVFVLVWPIAVAVRKVADDSPYRSPFLVAACAAGGVLCLPGVIRLLTWGAGGVVVAAAAAGLFVLIDLVVPWDRLHRRRQRLSYGEIVQLSVSDQQLEDPKLIESLRCPLSIEELCGVWYETTMTLAEGADLRDRQAVAEVRRICLDEFERHNPNGFQRWIEAGAAGDPGSFLLPRTGE
ncbi:MAG TPA: hypothetical protein VGD71_39190 [Kribbella sp.]